MEAFDFGVGQTSAAISNFDKSTRTMPELRAHRQTAPTGTTPASVGWGLGDHGLPGGGATAVAKNCDLKDESSSDETWQTGLQGGSMMII